MTVRMALLGAGRIGQVHANAISANPDASLVAVADAARDAGEAIVATHGGAVRSVDTIADDGDIDAVVICTPTNTHCDLIEKFAKAGKAIFCEKPIDLNADRARACLEIVASSGAVLMVGFNRRFDPHFAALKQAISIGQVGQVEQVLITSRDPGLPAAGYLKGSGGIFRDMTIHDLDMARFLLDTPIVRVFAVGAALIDPDLKELGDFDTVTVVLETASGRQVVINNSRRASYGYDQRIEVHGSAGMVAAENQRPVNIEVASSDGFFRPPLHDFFMTRYRDAYAAEIAQFIAAVRNDAPVPVSGADGLAALVLADAATQSAEQGVAIDLDPQDFF